MSQEKNKLEERREKANHTPNQNIDDGNDNEVQGKLAIPHEKVLVRGNVKWTDEDMKVHKKLAAQAVDGGDDSVEEGEEIIPEYLKVHQEILDGGDRLEVVKKYEDLDDYAELPTISEPTTLNLDTPNTDTEDDGDDRTMTEKLHEKIRNAPEETRRDGKDKEAK